MQLLMLSVCRSKLKKMSASNATIKRIQKTFDDRPSPQAEEADLLERYVMRMNLVVCH